MFHKIIDPKTNKTFSIFSKNGKQLLKQYVKLYQKGGDFDDCVDDCFGEWMDREPIDGQRENNNREYDRCIREECEPYYED